MLKRVLSSIVAVAMFATMAISASAEAGQGITNGNDTDSVGKPMYVFDAVKDLGDDFVKVTKVEVAITPADTDLPDGIGGGLGIDSATKGWSQVEYGNADAGKEVSLTDDFKIIVDKGEAFFDAADKDEKALVVILHWWGSDMTVDSIKYFDADGNVLNAAADKPADDKPADDKPADDKPAADKNPTTGVGGMMALVGISSLAATSLVISKKRK